MSPINSTRPNTLNNSNLKTPQGTRQTECKSEFRRSALIAALAFVAVGAVSYIGLQKITTAPAEPVVQTAETSPNAALLLALELLLEREKETARQTEELAATNAALIGTPVAPTAPSATLSAPIETAATQVALATTDEGHDTTAHDTHATPVAAATNCYDEVVNTAKEATIFFRVGSATLTPEDTPKLRKLGALVADCPDALVHVTGHSDASGDDTVNMTLSWQRADNIVAAVAALGLDASRFEAVGFGARSPLSQGGASDEDLNRRVEFMIVRDHH
ncbi:MAG: OmpA family protein [Litoreibacter sp.]|uniref:OmpA family protein n=1 Tax=Litoreibacter sp. TaxID=1969459 RepID=UPI00329A4412